MWFFKKKKTDQQKLMESKEKVAKNAQLIDVLSVLAEGKTDMLEKLAELKDTLKYLTPTLNEKANAIDDKIAGAIGDMKIELSKAQPNSDCGRADKYLSDIKLLIAERSVYTKR